MKEYPIYHLPCPVGIESIHAYSVAFFLENKNDPVLIAFARDRADSCQINVVLRISPLASRGPRTEHPGSAEVVSEQITSQIKAMIMSGELKTGDPIPSMRALAKSIHVSVITVQKAYEDLQRDGFIETTVGRGSFVSAQNKDFYQEEQQRLAEEHLQEAADIGRISGISLEKLIELLTIFYQEED